MGLAQSVWHAALVKLVPCGTCALLHIRINHVKAVSTYLCIRLDARAFVKLYTLSSLALKVPTPALKHKVWHSLDYGAEGRRPAFLCRIHQFEKVEQFFVTSCNNNASWEAFEEMLSNAEDFYTSLGLHYQVFHPVLPDPLPMSLNTVCPF